MARVRDARTTKGCHAAVVYKRATDCPTHDAWCHMREMRPETGSRSLAAALVTGTIVVVIADVPDVCGGAAGATILNGVAPREVVVRVAIVEGGELPVRVVVLDQAGRAAKVRKRPLDEDVVGRGEVELGLDLGVGVAHALVPRQAPAVGVLGVRARSTQGHRAELLGDELEVADGEPARGADGVDLVEVARKGTRLDRVGVDRTEAQVKRTPDAPPPWDDGEGVPVVEAVAVAA